MKHKEALHTIQQLVPGVVYAVAATADGHILSEVGSAADLPYRGILAYALAPEGVRAFYEEILDYRAKGPDFVPRMYGQGAVLGIVDSPLSDVVVFAFGVSPAQVAGKDPEEAVEWMETFRESVKAALIAAYSKWEGAE